MLQRGIAILRTILIVSASLFVGLLGFAFYTAFSVNIAPPLDNSNHQLNENASIPLRCAIYTRQGEERQYCATCGNGICEIFEKCSSSAISEGGIATADCGSLYCPGDCEDPSTNRSTNTTPGNTNTFVTTNTNSTITTNTNNAPQPIELRPNITGTCGDGICEVGEQCNGPCSYNPATNETACLDSCGQWYCNQDCK